MGFFRSVSGTVTLQLTSADPMGTINALQKANIPILDLEKKSELQYYFCVYRKSVQKVRKIADKRGDSLSIYGKEGLFWAIMELRKRPVLVLGLLALLIVSLWVPSRVFFVQVEGNSTVPTKQIIEQAQLAGIGFGASRREVRSEKMKNNLLNIMPQLQWAGVNTYGCVAVITVRERNDLQKAYPTPGISSIVAACDGVVREMTVTKGSALCKPGQAVKAGQVLVSGYTDCGLYIQATRAEAEIFGQTQRNLTVLFPTNYELRTEKREVKKKYSLIIGKKRINFAKDSGILGTGCAKIESEYYMTLPGGFQMPVGVIVEQFISYDTETAAAENPEPVLRDFAKTYLQQKMTAGKIEHSAEVFTELADAYRLDGSYSCYEMLGISRIEENLNRYGKNH